jgi:hypothetical protein
MEALGVGKGDRGVDAAASCTGFAQSYAEA